MPPSAGRVLRVSQRGEVWHEVEGLRFEISARRKGGGGARDGVWRMWRRLHPLRLRDQHGQSQGSDDPAQTVHCENLIWQNCVLRPTERLIRAGRQQGQVIFLRFDFFGNSNDHSGNSLSSSGMTTA